MSLQRWLNLSSKSVWCLLERLEVLEHEISYTGSPGLCTLSIRWQSADLPANVSIDSPLLNQVAPEAVTTIWVGVQSENQGCLLRKSRSYQDWTSHTPWLQTLSEMGHLSDEICSIVGNLLMQKHSSKRDFGLSLYLFLKSTALLLRELCPTHLFSQQWLWSLLSVSGGVLVYSCRYHEKKRHTFSVLLALKFGWGCQTMDKNNF